jgi:pantetheine-phosphate adenylyltransferase
MKALYPGSFDPPHLGHLELIRRAAALVDELVVGIAVNPDKTPYLPIAQRLALLRADCAELQSVSVVSYQGATVHAARALGAGALLRGLRNANDLEAEQAMAMVNRSNGFETLLLLSSSEHLHISSRLVRLTADAGLELTGLVGPRVAAALRKEPPDAGEALGARR